MAVATARRQTKGFNREVFARRLSVARHVRGFNQAQLARKSGTIQSSICKFETGERSPSVENLYALASALYVSLDYLVGNTPDEQELNCYDGLQEKDITLLCLLQENMRQYNEELYE